MKSIRSNLIVFSAIALILLVFTYFITSFKNESYKIINKTDAFKEIIDSNKTDILIIDLRDETDYIISHIDEAINIPYNDDGEYLLSYLKKRKYENKKIYLICYSGNRSSQAFNLLFDHGFSFLNYITFGYDIFVNEMGSDFTPSTGECKCKSDF